ncbi:DNA repair protein RecO [Gracilimonas mengyeensis]|uniref:DNA repair protein RecO n=1 Tax=Gracilimonas mengyeensis TaxID=1302730 RepID=A0A521AAK3_9BACT|nr:DNA repair protein RecO [Gracilimonas mengyeensis]SMO31751.1 DNA repair protein RecO [Gracilimonas mengyeensis]
MITHTQAIILRSIDYQESSKILTVLSEEHGKIALMARGAKKPKSTLSGIIEPGSVLDVVYYYKASRGVQTLTEASKQFSTDIFRRDFERAAVLYATLELVAQLVHDNEVNEPVYAFSYQVIKWLAEADEIPGSVFAYVQLRLAELIGIGLYSMLEDYKNTVYLNVSSGNISEQAEDELSYKLSEAQGIFVIMALHSKSRKVLGIKLENAELKQLVHHLDVYFKYHIEGYRERRSDSIFEQMLL